MRRDRICPPPPPCGVLVKCASAMDSPKHVNSQHVFNKQHWQPMSVSIRRVCVSPLGHCLNPQHFSVSGYDARIWAFPTCSPASLRPTCSSRPGVVSRGANRNPKFRNSENDRIPIRYSDGRQLISSDNFGRIHLSISFYFRKKQCILCWLSLKKTIHVKTPDETVKHPRKGT